MLDGKADVPERMNVDIADMIGPRNVLDPDDRLRHVSSTAGCRRDYSRGRGTLERAFGESRCSETITLSPRFRSPLNNLGEIVVVESGRDLNGYRLAVAEHPNARPDPIRELRCRPGYNATPGSEHEARQLR